MSDRYWETERGCCSECLRNSDHQTKCCETAAHRFKELSLLRAKVERYEKALEMIKYDLENCDWECDNCHHDPEMKHTDIYFFAEKALSDVGSENCPHGLSYCVRCQTEGKWNIGSEGEKA